MNKKHKLRRVTHLANRTSEIKWFNYSVNGNPQFVASHAQAHIFASEAAANKWLSHYNAISAFLNKEAPHISDAAAPISQINLAGMKLNLGGAKIYDGGNIGEEYSYDLIEVKND